MTLGSPRLSATPGQRDAVTYLFTGNRDWTLHGPGGSLTCSPVAWGVGSHCLAIDAGSRPAAAAWPSCTGIRGALCDATHDRGGLAGPCQGRAGVLRRGAHSASPRIGECYGWSRGWVRVRGVLLGAPLSLAPGGLSPRTRSRHSLTRRSRLLALKEVLPRRV